MTSGVYDRLAPLRAKSVRIDVELLEWLQHYQPGPFASPNASLRRLMELTLAAKKNKKSDSSEAL